MASTRLASTVLKSLFFRKALGKAGRTIGKVGSLYALYDAVMKKSGEEAKSQGSNRWAVISGKLSLLGRLVKAYASGQYRAIPWKSLVSIVAVLLYFVNPIDLIPDFLPLIGLADDVALTVWLFNSVSRDLAAFESWEKTRTVPV